MVIAANNINNTFILNTIIDLLIVFKRIDMHILCMENTFLAEPRFVHFFVFVFSSILLHVKNIYLGSVIFIFLCANIVNMH